MRPTIGITSYANPNNDRKLYETGSNYINVILRTGALPVILPILDDTSLIDEYLPLIDGLIMPGGSDIAAQFWGEEPLDNAYGINYSRDMFDIELVRRARKSSKPILGICRGAQVINVALGGSLYQHIPAQIENNISHQQRGPIDDLFHSITANEGSILHQIWNKTNILTNSSHHQSVKDIAPSLFISSLAKDGVIESFESEDSYIHGVQFHPEMLADKYDEFFQIFVHFTDHIKNLHKI